MPLLTQVNGMLLNGKKVFVGRFIPRKEREKELGEKARRFTNVYVKNFGTELDEQTLREMFEQFGTISSLKVVTGEDGTSKGESTRLRGRASGRVWNLDRGGVVRPSYLMEAFNGLCSFFYGVAVSRQIWVSWCVLFSPVDLFLFDNWFLLPLSPLFLVLANKKAMT